VVKSLVHVTHREENSFYTRCEVAPEEAMVAPDDERKRWATLLFTWILFNMS
jgi:hypothetical protein